ncbi:SDR family NAD(P)-dependent oxidoreductase [Pseudonocardia benzenivorans]
MNQVTCECGFQTRDAQEGPVVTAVLDHVRSDHPDLQGSVTPRSCAAGSRSSPTRAPLGGLGSRSRRSLGPGEAAAVPGRVDGMTNPRRARIAIVTGGASGIGRGLGAALVTRGDTVVLADVDIEGATSAADAMSARGPGTAVATELDVRDGSAVEKLVADTVDARGGLDIMVNNAGLGIGGPVEELTSAHWDRVVDVNLRGVVHGVHAAYPVMVEQRRGHIVNTASMAGLVPCPGLTSYATTKWGSSGCR